ncbi:EKC/KEOPS complex subunit GON7 [Suncus etruscus]|uniref:EKC/KEOPS complex subunit GON7 n=1 Tax=Suncus etruscus TaxID=109475 RepID=UPI0021101BF7|nr:EKC/KEOPS complex subunit GON7 [Suncus etruscus]
MELVGSYVDPDGQQQVLRVPCEAPDDDDAESFKSLLSGLAQMRELVRELLQDPLDPMAAVPDADSAQASDEGEL